MKSRQPNKCTCGTGGADRGDLETHILDQTDAGHQPVDQDDWTPLVKAHVEGLARRDATRAKLAETAGVSVTELIEAIK